MDSVHLNSIYVLSEVTCVITIAPLQKKKQKQLEPYVTSFNTHLIHSQNLLDVMRDIECIGPLLF